MPHLSVCSGDDDDRVSTGQNLVQTWKEAVWESMAGRGGHRHKGNECHAMLLVMHTNWLHGSVQLSRSLSLTRVVHALSSLPHCRFGTKPELLTTAALGV